MESPRLILAYELGTRPHLKVPLLDTSVYSSLASLHLEYSLQSNLISARSIDTLAVSGWAPDAFGPGHVRNKSMLANLNTIVFYL
jgi:hypothetical protein